MLYNIRAKELSADPAHPFSIHWEKVEPLSICNFHPKSSDHHPVVTARAVHDGESIIIRFDVQDRYVRCIATEYQQSVCLDSCVEAFIEPVGGKGYFNFEFSAIGTLLTYYVEDPRPASNGEFVKYSKLPVELLEKVKVEHDLKGPIIEEITTPTVWSLTARIPIALMSVYTGPISMSPGARWRGNFYKCGDQTSHPHWASWSPIGERLKFHQPDRFGELVIG